MLSALGAGVLQLIVSEHGPVTIGCNLSLASHIVTEKRVHDDVMHACLVCKCEFYMKVSAFT